MAFSSTIDARPHVMGDMVMLTGTYNGAGATAGLIDVSAQLSSVVAAGVNGDLPGTGAGVDGAFVVLSAAAPTTLTLDFISGATGSWWALGRRS